MRLGAFLKDRPVPAALIILAVAAVLSILVYYAPDLKTRLSPGETLTVQAGENVLLRANETEVKIAGTPVGRVQSVDQMDNGAAEIVVKVRNGTRQLLGSEPSAIIRPLTILGGRYQVELRSGGNRGEFTGDVIPMERTKLPVELDKVLAAIPPDSQQGLRGMTERMDATLRAGAGNDLEKLLKEAPDGLRPAGVVLDGFRGVNKDSDLATLTATANTTARVLSEKPGQLRSVVDSLAGTAKEFGDNSGALARTISDLPETMRATRVGAKDLSTTLDKLVDTADDARPIVRELDPALEELDPALHELRPVAADLRPLLEDARPLLDKLVPTVERGTDVLAGAEGKALDTINGPILSELNKEWKGEGPKYPNGGRDGAKFYEEIGYILTGLNGMTMYQTATSHYISFQFLSGGPGLFQGTGPEAEALQAYLGGRMWGLPHQGEKGGSRNEPIVPGTGQGFGIPAPDGVAPPVIDPNGSLGKGPNK